MENRIIGRITKVNRGQYTVSIDEKEMAGLLAGKLVYLEQYPVIGDYVGVEVINENEVIILEIKERFSYLSRPDDSGHGDGYVKTIVEQPMAANLDYLFIISSLNDDFSVNRIARFAASSITGGCKPVAILTKADLCSNKEEMLAQVRQLNSSMDAFCVSSYTGEGMDEVRKYLQPGITIGLMGSSGVGKSTLINTLAGKEVMKVSEIRGKDAKGRHTTTHREMLNVQGTYFIDTPGMRGFALCDVEEGINETFDDIAELIGTCRFRNCKHKTEPGCSIRAAIEAGGLSKKKWNLYSSLMEESSRSKSLQKKKQIAIQKRKMGL